jgi:tetratricopeptide (TPR) repeat protein
MQLLDAALREHQAGRLEQAKAVYQQILLQDPSQADAWHLLGVAALQQGAAAEGVERINHAIALRPGVPAYHVNLAEGYLALGQTERAVGCCRMALRLQPDGADAAHVLGRAYLALGRKEEATEQFRHAVRCRPDFALAHNSLANTLRELGELTEALEHFRRACEVEPQRGELHSNLGQILLERGEPEEALRHCREAVRLLPDMPEAHCNLGNVLRELGQLTEAKACYVEALRLNPDLAMVHNNMGQALQEEGYLDEAITWYERALSMEPNVARFVANLADVLAEQDKREEALVTFERALRLDPSYVPARSGLGALFREMGRYDEARAQFREALRLKPELAGAHCALGEMAEEMGDRESAEASFREALRLDPKFPGVYAQLATLLRARLGEAERQTMRRLLEDPKVRPLGRANLLHGLAHVHDGAGDYAQAAACLQQAKGIQLAEWAKRNQRYDPGEHHQFVERLLAAYTPEFFARVRGWGLETERPVFVFGLPRSGTTLVEQVLASHSQVHGAGELTLAQESFRALPALLGVQGAPLDCLGRLEAAHVRRLAQRHLDRLGEINRDRARVTDKMPDNYTHLGLLATLFPRARFIHCRRDLRDVAVSCWSTNFRSIRWNAEAESIASRFGEYQRLLEHWARVLPVRVLEVHYEETVADLEGVARRLVAWCGLEWEPGCLEFHRHDRPVRTASVNQVRRPVYKSSVGRWQNYELALAGLFENLRG